MVQRVDLWLSLRLPWDVGQGDLCPSTRSSSIFAELRFFVLETLILAIGPDLDAFYCRTADGAEFDLVIEQAENPWVAVEVNRASAPQAERGFFVACDDSETENGVVVGAGAEDYPAKGGAKVRTLMSAVREVREIAKSTFATYVLFWNF